MSRSIGVSRSIEEEVREIRIRCERLRDLLAEQQFGLATWHVAIGKALDDIAEHAPSYERITRLKRFGGRAP